MAKPLVFKFKGVEAPFKLSKVSRDTLYARIDHETVDDAGERVSLAKIAADGRTLVGHGGIALAAVSQDGEWLPKNTLKPVDAQGNLLSPVQSSFSAPVEVEAEADADELIAHNVRLVYNLIPEGDAGAALVEALRAGKVFRVPFSYRGGVGEAESGFIRANDQGDIFLLVGREAKFHFVGLEAPVAEEAEENGIEEEEGDLDFTMI